MGHLYTGPVTGGSAWGGLASEMNFARHRTFSKTSVWGAKCKNAIFGLIFSFFVKQFILVRRYVDGETYAAAISN